MAMLMPITSQSGMASGASVAAAAKRTPPATPPLTSIRSGQPKVTATMGGTRAPSPSAEPEHRDQDDRQRRLERLLGRQHHGALAGVLADAPKQRAGLGALDREPDAALERIEVGGDRERPQEWRKDRPLGHAAAACPVHPAASAGAALPRGRSVATLFIP